MAILLSNDVIEKIARHGSEAYPDECCGVILGIERKDRNQKLVADVLPVRNSRAANQTIQGAPAELVEVLKDAYRLLNRVEPKNPAVQEWLLRAEPMVNSARNRFRIDPKDLLACDEIAEKRKLYILGFYHSHPDHPAVPSEFDRQHLLNPWYTTYLILRVERGVPKETSGWAPSEDGEQFVAEDMQLISEQPA